MSILTRASVSRLRAWIRQLDQPPEWAFRVPAPRELRLAIWDEYVRRGLASEAERVGGHPGWIPPGMHSWVLAAMLLLAPGRDHHVLADAIDRVVAAEAPLFRDDADKRKTSALLVAVAFRESSLRNDISSKTNDHCAFQVHGRPELRKDAEDCTRVAIAMLRESLKQCPEFPIAWYAAGPKGCADARARRISSDRMMLARWLLLHVASETP